MWYIHVHILYKTHALDIIDERHTFTHTLYVIFIYSDISDF